MRTFTIPTGWHKLSQEAKVELLQQHQQDMLGEVEHRVSQLLPLVAMHWAAHQQPGSDAFAADWAPWQYTFSMRRLC